MDYLCSDAGIAPKSLIFFLCLFVVNFTDDTLLITQLIQYQDGLFLVPLLMDSDITEVPALFASTPMVDIRDPTNRYSNMYHSIAEALITLLRTADQQNRFRRVSVIMG